MQKLSLFLFTVLFVSCNTQKSVTRVSIDENWDLYTNRQLGFQLKIPKSVKTSLANNSEDILSSSDYGGWTIIKREVESEDTLLQLIKNEVGNDCIILSRQADTSGSYILDVQDGTDKEFGEADCKPRYSAWYFVYSPNRKVLFYWNMGQEYQFENINHEYKDSEMLASFRVL